MAIPITRLSMLVYGARAVPSNENPKVKLLRKNLSRYGNKMMEKYKRSIIMLPKEKAARASVDKKDAFEHTAKKVRSRVISAMRKDQKVRDICDVESLQVTPDNADALAEFKKFSALIDRTVKQLPALTPGEPKKK